MRGGLASRSVIEQQRFARNAPARKSFTRWIGRNGESPLWWVQSIFLGCVRKRKGEITRLPTFTIKEAGSPLHFIPSELLLSCMLHSSSSFHHFVLTGNSLNALPSSFPQPFHSRARSSLLECHPVTPSSALSVFPVHSVFYFSALARSLSPRQISMIPDSVNKWLRNHGIRQVFRFRDRREWGNVPVCGSGRDGEVGERGRGGYFYFQ